MKSPENQRKRGRKPDRPGETSARRPPPGGLGHRGSTNGQALLSKHLGDARSEGTPWLQAERVLDVSPSVDSKMNSKSDETKSTTNVTKRASQRLKNHIDIATVLQEKPQKPKETGQKTRSTRRNKRPEPPTWGARP